MSSEPFVVLTSWGGAQYFDWWVLVHILSGLLFGLALRLFGVSFWSALAVGAVLIIGWEVYEGMAHIAEPWSNTILDIVWGLVAFFVAYRYIHLSNKTSEIILLAVLLAVSVGLNLWGWVSWKKRIAQEKQAVPVATEQERTL